MTNPEDRRAPVLVWDLPVRLFHWAMVGCFAGAWLTSESERWRLLHTTLGYTLAGLVLFRLLWGVVGTRHARFSSFVRGPRAALGYLRSLLTGRPQHFAGHNPAGALAIVALLGLGLAVVASGWANEQNLLAGEWLHEVHEAAASLMLGVVGVHVAGVVLGSWLHRENLVRAMWTGRKAGRSGDGIRSPRRLVAALLLALLLGFWWQQWRDAPAQGTAAVQRHSQNASHRADADDND
jgi:cytochrome b